MSWAEKIPSGTEPIKNEYWKSPEGAKEAYELTFPLIKSAMNKNCGLWEILKPGMYGSSWNPVSPLENSSKDGLRTIVRGYMDGSDEDIKFVNEVQKALKTYNPKIMIGASIFIFHRIAIGELIDPRIARQRTAEVDNIYSKSKKGAKSRGEIIENLEKSLLHNESFQMLQFPKSRVKYFMEPSKKVSEDPQLLRRAIQRVRMGWGNRGKHGHKINPYNESIALSLEYMFRNELS